MVKHAVTIVDVPVNIMEQFASILNKYTSSIAFMAPKVMGPGPNNLLYTVVWTIMVVSENQDSLNSVQDEYGELCRKLNSVPILVDNTGMPFKVHG